MTIPFHDVPWLLATGQGRSGTTVLTRALASHPRVCSNQVESNVMKDVLLAGHSSSTMPSRIRQMVLQRDKHDALFREMLTQLLFPAALWTDQEAPLAVSTFSAMVPPAAEYAVQILPGIHFANIVRNGIEVVASRMVHRVLGQHSFEDQCVAWAASVEMARWGQDRDDFTLVRHEDLLCSERCRGSMLRLLERAGLPESDDVVEYFQSNHRNQTRYESENDQSAGDLTQRQLRWQTWDDGQRDQFVAICSEAMNYFEYEIPW